MHKKINKGRANRKGHGCNAAEFEVWLNKIRIGTVNLNNAYNDQSVWAKNAEPNTPSGSREGKIVINNFKSN